MSATQNSKSGAGAQAKHFPKQLRLKSGGFYTGILGDPHPVDGGDYAPIAEGTQPEVMAEIVRRYNSHSELLQILRILSKVFNNSNFTDRGGYGAIIDNLISRATERPAAK